MVFWSGAVAQSAVPQLALMQAALDCAATGLLGVDGHGNVLLCNRAAISMLGVGSAAAESPTTLARLLDASTALDPGERAKFASTLVAGRAPGARIATRGGDILRVTVGEQLATQVVTIETESRVGQGADGVDALTGLSDRACFHKRLAALLADAVTPDHVAVLMIDLDQFKAVNDTHGHPIGKRCGGDIWRLVSQP